MIPPDHLPLHVEKLLWRGRGLARLESGQVVILDPGVLPGETVLAQITRTARDFVQARAVEILTPSVLRGIHPCPHARECGGSRFGILAPDAALALKADMARDAVSRSLGRNGYFPDLALVPSPHAWRYRWRGQIHVQAGRPHAVEDGTNELVPLQDCHLLAEPLARALPALAQGLPDGRFTIAASPDTGQAHAEQDRADLSLSFPDFGLTLLVSPDTFFQANWGLNQHLVRAVCDALDGCDLVADLFAGAGNFALPLATRGTRVLAVEKAASAVRQGQTNVARHSLAGVSFRAADLSKPREWRHVHDFGPQAAILDPPRIGARGIAQLLDDVPTLRRLVWISCDLVNTIRDLRPLLATGWTLSAAQLYDMFPGTWHMEILLILDRDRVPSL